MRQKKRKSWMLFFFFVWLTTQKDFSTCRIWKRSLISQLLGDVFVNVGVCRSVNSISCLYAHVSVSVYWWKPDVCLCEFVCRAGFSVRMCACMWLFVHTCPHVSCYRLSINVWEMCLHTCLAAAVFVCKGNGWKALCPKANRLKLWVLLRVGMKVLQLQLLSDGC